MLLRFLLAILIIGALGIGGFFVKSYFDENAAGDKLQVQIQETNKSIVNSSNQMQSLKAELEAIEQNYSRTQAAIDAEKGVLPERTNPNQIVEEILLQGKIKSLRLIPRAEI